MRYLLGNFIEKINLKGNQVKFIGPSARHLLRLEKIPLENIPHHQKSIFRVFASKRRYNY